MKTEYGHEQSKTLPTERRIDMKGTHRILAGIEFAKIASYLAIAAIVYTTFGL